MRCRIYSHQTIDRIADNPSSIIAVQGLGAHPYYTWVKNLDQVKGEKTGKLSLSKFLQKRRAPTPKSTDNGESSTNIPEVMWLRDLLPDSIRNARIASYSYESDWRKDVKTNLRKCGEQFLNVLHQSRAGDQVDTISLKFFSYY